MPKTPAHALEDEAERRTNERYLRNGYFGGKTTAMEKGAVKSIRYFDHTATKTQIKAELLKEGWEPIEKE